MQRFHPVTEGPMKGAFEVCTARRCSLNLLHLNEHELEAARIWLQDRNRDRFVYTYHVGYREAMQARSDPDYPELVMEAELLASAVPAMSLPRRSFLNRRATL